MCVFKPSVFHMWGLGLRQHFVGSLSVLLCGACGMCMLSDVEGLPRAVAFQACFPKLDENMSKIDECSGFGV